MNNRKIILFGAGKVGKIAFYYYKSEGIGVECFIDNDEKKREQLVCGKKVIGIQEYIQSYQQNQIVIATNAGNIREIEQQLLDLNIHNYILFNEFSEKVNYWTRRLISYCYPSDMEDVILYHALRSVNDIFYIDVGANDPTAYSVTKLLYDTRGARGINIEPLHHEYQLLKYERTEDINLCVGAGSQSTKGTFYTQGQLSTLISDNIYVKDCKAEDIKVMTLKEICNQYLVPKREITFLKIDVEGYEKEVLLGADFNVYRPWIIVMESMLPMTETPCYEEWESILIDAGYEYVLSYGVNRYYVAKEHSELKSQFEQGDVLKSIYNICFVDFEHRFYN